jgi:membrane-associated phospholipid phosphatase
MATTAKARAIRLRAVLPRPDPRSYLAYAALAELAIIACASTTLTGIRFEAIGWAFSELAVIIIFVAWMARRAGHPKIGDGLETMAFAYLVSVAGLVSQYTLMALPLPFVDGALSRIDRLLGFDWWALAQLFSNRWLWGTMFVAYSSIIPQLLLLLPLLTASGRSNRAWQFVTAATIAMLATMILLPFFPADGSLALCSLGPDSPWVAKGACNYGSIIHQLKGGQLKVLNQSALTGLVSFPSFHTSIALQFIWAFWPYRWLRWPIVAFNVLLICGAIVIASHYFIDILGGALIGALAIKLAVRTGGAQKPVCAQ